MFKKFLSFLRFEWLGAPKSKVTKSLLAAIGPVFWAALVGYFVYHAIQGPRGLIMYSHLKGEVRQAEGTLNGLTEERKQLEARTSRLRTDSLDPDLLDERARELLNYSRPDEVVIILPPDEGEKK